MVDLRGMRRVWTAAARRASGGRSVWISLGMAVAFVCSGCVDLTKPWEGAEGLEWSIPSPAPYHTFTTPPEVK